MNGQNVKIGPDSGAGYKPPQGLSPGRLARLAWLPVPLLLAAIIVARAAGLSESYMSEPLRLALSLTFYTLVSLGTLFLIGRSFLATGKPGLLLLECGVILWSLAGTVGDAVAPNDANVNATIFNTVIFLAGLCHLAGAVLSLRPRQALDAAPLWLLAASALALGALWLVTHAALAGWLPVFFIPGQGGTLVRYCVLISAVAAFVLSAGLMLAGQREARAPFTAWYALAMLSLSVGLFGIMIQLSFGSVVNWLARTAQWLGGLYLLFAAVAALRESNLPLFPPERKSLPERYSYGVAIAIVITATAVRFALSAALGKSSPFLTFYPAVILAALYGGLRAGLLTTVLSALIADYFWIEPAGQFTIGGPIDWLTVLLFLLACTMISFAIEAMHKARVGLVLYRDHLEELVKDRTDELEREAVERRQAEAALRESEEKYRSLFENLNSAALLVEPVLDVGGRLVDLRYLMVNPSVEKHLGKTPDELVGKLYSEVFTYPGRNPVFDIYDKVNSSGEPFKGEILLPATQRYFDMAVYRPIAGRLALVLSDITERKQAEAELRKARDELELRVAERTSELVEAGKNVQAERQRFLNVLDTLPTILVIIRPDYRIEWTNRAYREALGENTGRLCYESQFGRDKPCEECEAFSPLSSGKPHNWEWALPNGRTFDIYNFPFVGEDGSALILEMDIDITDQRNAEMERTKLESQLRQSHKLEALGVLSGGIAHDFNNILAVIIGFAEVAQGKTAGNAAAEKALKRVFEAGIRGRDIVKQMLTFSRKSEQEKKPLQLSSILKESMKLLRASIPSTVSIKINVKSESSLIMADPVQMQQILMNLCVNASHAMMERGGVLGVELSDYSLSAGNEKGDGIKPGLYMKLTVSDTGVGIPTEIIDKIFDPFFTTKKLGEGTGLGLSVVHGIVSQHNGYITVESEPGKGATFTVYLPKFHEAYFEDKAADDTVPSGHERVLFVDDEEPLAEMGEDILSDLGYNVTVKTSSKEALALLKADPSRFDLVITDQTMPDVTGIELAREILALRPGLPIIMATGFSHIVDADKAKAAGIRAFVMKPLTKKEIARAARKVLDEKT